MEGKTNFSRGLHSVRIVVVGTVGVVECENHWRRV